MAVKHDNCKDCHSECEHAGKDREFVCINGISCKITKGKPQTNADRIRAMSDEELAEMLNRIIICHQLRLDGWYCSKCPLYGAKPCDTEGILNLLKQPAKDGVSNG